MIFWMIGIVIVGAVLFNLEDLTANVTKSGVPTVKEPVLRVLNPNVEAGNDLIIKISNMRSLTSSRLYMYDDNGRYSGVSFPVGRGDCEFASAGYYDCETSYNIPHSILPNGRYYIQVKSDSSGDVIGNKAFFTISNSQYKESGR